MDPNYMYAMLCKVSRMNNSTVGESSFKTTDKAHIGAYLFTTTTLTWTIGANLFILICFIRNRKRRWTNFSRQTCSMTAGDLCVGLTVVPFVIIERARKEVDNAFCIVAFYLFFSMQCVTLLHVLCICILRHMKLKTLTQAFEPPSHDVYTKGSIVTSWLLALGVMMVPYAIWSQDNDSRYMCSVITVFGSNRKEAVTFIGVLFLTLQVITNSIYLITCCGVWSAIQRNTPSNVTTQPPSASASISVTATSGSQISNIQSSAETGSSITLRMPISQALLSTIRNQKQVIITIGILLLIFNLFTLPVTITSFVTVRSKPAGPSYSLLVTSLFFFNSGLNPIVYATRNPFLRDAIKSQFREIKAFLRC